MDMDMDMGLHGAAWGCMGLQGAAGGCRLLEVRVVSTYLRAHADGRVASHRDEDALDREAVVQLEEQLLRAGGIGAALGRHVPGPQRRARRAQLALRPSRDVPRVELQADR